MMVEASVMGRKQRDDPGAELATEEGSPSSRKGKRRHKKSGAIQRLYEACKEVFADGRPDTVPSPEDVGRIKSILDNMKPGDVGLGQKLPFSGNMESGGAPPITYLPIYDCPKFSKEFFMENENCAVLQLLGTLENGLRAPHRLLENFLHFGDKNLPLWVSRHLIRIGRVKTELYPIVYLILVRRRVPRQSIDGVIPLHNHPGMTVFSKLLVGSMHIKSYDWVGTGASQNLNETTRPSQSQNPSKRLAKVKKDTVFTAPCETSVLYPAAGGNMHCFTARTACAVLDVLGPPYSDVKGRHCQYYNDYPYSSSSGDDAELPGEGEYAWLEEKPVNFLVVGATYQGPKIVEK